MGTGCGRMAVRFFLFGVFRLWFAGVRGRCRHDGDVCMNPSSALAEGLLVLLAAFSAFLAFASGTIVMSSVFICGTKGVHALPLIDDGIRRQPK
jgi:hypothetical protein